MAALADEVDYTVYYMSAFSGRAETLHIMLADACAQWTTGSKDDLLSSQAGTCVFQVPAIKDHANGLVFSQTTTAVKYLAKKLAGGGEFARVTRKGPFPKAGDEDCDLINAGKQTVTERDGASFFSADQSFAMIRGAHCQVTILGSMQVAANGDMANYLIPGKLVKGMGGAMDLVASGSRVVVTMEHCDKHGNSKILPTCTLPLTGRMVVDMIVTERAVFKVKPEGNGLLLVEVAEGETIDSIRECTEANFEVAEALQSMKRTGKPRHSMMDPTTARLTV